MRWGGDHAEQKSKYMFIGVKKRGIKNSGRGSGGSGEVLWCNVCLERHAFAPALATGN